MERNSQIERMEGIYYTLGQMKLTKAQRAQLAPMLRSAFINGFQTALADHAGITGEAEQYTATSENETCRHIIFLDQQNSK